MTKRLPINVSDFSTMMTGNYVYVDKTQYIYDLINEKTGSRYFFLSRPRRFGKSLLISTLHELFSGNKQLFKDLWIDSSDYSWQEYPVIYLDFAGIANESSQALEESLGKHLSWIAALYEVDISGENLLKDKFTILVKKLAEKNKVVLLIDEYDKPLLDNIKDIQLTESIRNILDRFYDSLKSLDRHLRAVFITGVTKFSKTSIFSGLNNLNDISIDPIAASLLGYTEDELKHYFDAYIEILTQVENKSIDRVYQDIKEWYNGYQFTKVDVKVYNPFSILYLLHKKEFLNFWFESGTPSFLIKLLETQYKTLENLEATELSSDSLGYFQINKIPLIPLLFQTGYLTISHYDKSTKKFNLGFPNFEVENSFKKYLITVLAHSSSNEVEDARSKLIKALKTKNLSDFCMIIQSLFSHIPYTLHIGKESYYHSLFQFLMSFLSLEVQSEQLTNQGRIDMSISIDDIVYIFELKLNSEPEKALAQIYEKKYYERFLLSGKKIILVGLAFSTSHNGFNIKYVSEALK